MGKEEKEKVGAQAVGGRRFRLCGMPSNPHSNQKHELTFGRSYLHVNACTRRLLVFNTVYCISSF